MKPKEQPSEIRLIFVWIAAVIVFACLFYPWGQRPHKKQAILAGKGSSSMANTQIPQGGSGIVSLITTGQGGSSYYQVLDPSGTQVAIGNYQTANNGYNTTNFDTNARTVRVTVPASATIGTNYTLNFNTPDGSGATSEKFDVGSPVPVGPSSRRRPVMSG